MAVPTQAFPPWLSSLPVTVTQDGTVVVQTTVIQFPQTYYGPSIPLGPGWVFGGSTFPASIATSFASSTPIPSFMSTSSPSQTSTSSTSLSPSSSSSSSSSINPSTSSSPLTSIHSSPSPLPSSPSNVSHGISSGTRLAIILSTILGTLTVAALIIVLCLIRRRRRGSHAPPSGGNLSNWQLVNPSAAHQPLEAAAEEGEAGAFLPGGQSMRESLHESLGGPRLSRTWSNLSHQVGEPTALARSISRSSGSGSMEAKSDPSTLDSTAKREALSRFNASVSTVAAGSLFFNPSRGNDQGNGTRQSDEEPVEEAETSLTASAAATRPSSPPNYSVRPPGAGAPHVQTRSPDRPPFDPQYNLASPTSPDDDDLEEQFRSPQRLDPDRVLHLQNRLPSSGSRSSWVYPDSPPSETDERATLLTARRVNIGSVSHPALASSPPEKSKSHEDGTTSLGGEPDDHVVGRPSSPGTGSMRGLSGFARGLSRFSWFRRMEEHVGRSSTHRSSPSSSHRGSRPVSIPASRPASKRESGQASKPGTRPGTRPTSGVGVIRPSSGTWRHSGLLHPTYTPRPRSDVSFHGIESELGMRPPGTRISGTGSGSGGSGSGKSGGTIYHSVSSRPQTPMHAHHEREHLPTQPTFVTLPPDLNLADNGDTIRSVDMLDLPVPDRTLPFSEPLLPEPSLRPDTASSRVTGLAFPPGLVAVPHWDRGSHSSSSNRREERDLLEDAPPLAGGEWSSLRSKGSTNDRGNDDVPGTERTRGPVTRNSTGEQAVRVIAGDPATSETASFSSALRRADPSASSLRSPTNLGFALTPSVSLYASSHSDLISHSGSGSHSSRPSQHTASYSHSISHPSSQESEDGHPLPRGPAYHRASLSAMGGDGPPQLPLFRPFGFMQPPMERTIEDRETEDESGATNSRPNSGVSRPSEVTFPGTFASGSTSTGAPTTVSGVTVSSEKP